MQNLLTKYQKLISWLRAASVALTSAIGFIVYFQQNFQWLYGKYPVAVQIVGVVSALVYGASSTLTHMMDAMNATPAPTQPAQKS
jgi:hypothetical protein